MARALTNDERLEIVDEALLRFADLLDRRPRSRWDREGPALIRDAMAEVLGTATAADVNPTQVTWLIQGGGELLRSIAGERRTTLRDAAILHRDHVRARRRGGISARGVLIERSRARAARGARPFIARTANEIILSRGIGHAVYLERLKSSEARRVLAFLDSEVLPDLLARVEGRLAAIRARGFDVGPETSRRLAALLGSIDDIVREGLGRVESQVNRSALELAGMESAFTSGLVRLASPVSLSTSLPSPSRLREIVRSRPFQGRVLREWFQTQEDATRRAFKSKLRIGLAEGQTTAQIARSIRGEVGGTRRGVEGIVRTAVTHVSTHARDATYQENADLLRGWQFVATLDLRTTLTCIELDSRRDANGERVVYPIGEGPKPPRHWNCRSADVPVMKSAEALGLRRLPVGTRASLDGAVPESVTYEEWIRGQPFSRMVEVFGKTRAQLFRAGRLSVSDMVDQFGNPLTLREIADREGDVLGAAG